MAECKIEKIAGKHFTFFTKRFDRLKNKRIHFASAMTMTGNNEETIKYFYNQDGEPHKIKRALSFNQGLNKIWDEYRNMLLNSPRSIIPQYLELETTLPEFKYFS
jgi:hypothetical protein